MFINLLVLTFAYLTNAHKEGCCLNHKSKPKSPSHIANYDCSQLNPFGPNRCNEVYNGEVCEWNYGKNCHSSEIKKCRRVSFYETHYAKSIDVGKCLGKCEDSKCKPRDFYYIPFQQIDDFKLDTIEGKSRTDDELDNDLDTNLEVNLDDKQKKYVKIIKSCECENCDVEESSRTIEIPYNKCEGNCSDERELTCLAGIKDNFDLSNGIESSNPSSLLLSNYLSQCSAGVQNGFDVFVNDRCFGHTFVGCIKKDACNLKKALLNICLEAAPVSLTHTDGMILGFNGVSSWSKSLVSLNGGSWNPGERLCLTMDLSNLPLDNMNIMSNFEMVGHLDVAVQDDTAVDFVELKTYYDECEKCTPTSSVVNTLITDNKVSHYRNIKSCDCLSMSKCERRQHVVTYYPGTIVEQSVDIGLCLGRCNNNMCVAEEYENVNIVMLDSTISKPIKKIKSCKCGKLTWNGEAELKKMN